MIDVISGALGFLRTQNLEYLEFDSFSTLADGTQVPIFKNSIKIRGRVQALDDKYISRLGLDIKQNYIKIIVKKVLRFDIVNYGYDRIIFKNVTYDILTKKIWDTENKYTKAICVRI